jgi:hypothetical protein
MLRGIHRHFGLLFVKERQKLQVAEQENVFFNPTIRERDLIVGAMLSLLAFSDRRHATPKVHHAIADEHVGSRLFINGRDGTWNILTPPVSLSSAQDPPLTVRVPATSR